MPDEVPLQQPFGGVREDIRVLRYPNGAFVLPMKALATLDLPLSAVADVATLPWTKFHTDSEAE